MTITIGFGWWLVPAFVTIALIGGWDVFGIKMDRRAGGYFPDFAGGLMEAGGYAFAALFSIIAWLIWWGLK